MRHSSSAAAAALWAGRDPHVATTYERVVSATRTFGSVTAEVKKTSVHLVAGKGSAFAGVHARKSALLLTIRTAEPLAGKRVRKVDQVSRHRFHNDLLVASPADVDGELLAWLRAAYDLALDKE